MSSRLIRVRMIFSKSLSLVLLCALVSVVACQQAQAQSGRRSSPVRREPLPSSTSATPSPTETPATPSTKKVEGSKLNVVVTYYTENSIIQPEKALSVFDSFVRGLKKSTELNITTEKAMNRKSAVVRASAEQETFVIWLRFQPDLRDPDHPEMSSYDNDNLILNYIVFAPITARVKADGRIYCQCRQRNTTDINSGRAPKAARKKIAKEMPVVYTLEDMGSEAARRVLEAFEVSVH